MKKLLLLLALLFCFSLLNAQYNTLTIPEALYGTTFDLTIKDATKQLRTGNLTVTGAINNESFWGPTLFVNKGDEIHMNVTNNLNESTTIHWHGMHLPAVMDGGPHQIIPASTLWQPHWTVMNQASTLWYHPHLHDMAQAHMTKGIGGFIIVRDPIESALALPRTYGVDDIVLALTSRSYTSTNQFDSPANTPASTRVYGDYMLTNGTPNAQIIYQVDSNPNQTISLDASGNASIITSPLVTSNNYTLISVQDLTSGCLQTLSGSVSLNVLIAPTISTPTDYIVCDDTLNNDGIYCFDLTTKNPEITNDPTLQITYYETLTDAQTGATNFLTSPYCNINSAGLQTIYVRVVNPAAPTCYSTTSFNLVVNPLPLANPVITDYTLCDYTNPGDGVEVFTLNTKDTEIANNQVGVIVSYYDNQADATSQSNPLPNSYTNTPPSPEKIWINIKYNTTGCNSVSSFNLIVNPLPIANLPQDIIQCSNGATNQALFDLTINEGVVTGGNAGVSVTYFHSLADAQANQNSITTPATYIGTDGEQIIVKVTSISTGCFNTTTQILHVTLGPVANIPSPLHYCDPNNDGFGIFDLSTAIGQIAGSPLPAGVSVSFYETLTDATIGAAPPIISPYNNINPGIQIIYVRVFYTLTGCANIVPLQLIVDPTPEPNLTPNDLELCDDTGAVGFESFDLTTSINNILGNINPALTSVTFYISQADAQSGTSAIGNVTNFTNTTIWTQTIYVRVETIATGCFKVVPLKLIVHPLPNIVQPNYLPYTLCDDTAPTGFEVFDLSTQVATILGGQTGMSVTFYPSLTDAQNNTNSINVSHPNLLYQNTSITVQTLGIRITNTATNCYAISTMDIRVTPLPSPVPPTQPLTVCDANQDGFTTIDLTVLTATILQGANYIITYHETLADANLNGTTIPNPTLYQNINPFLQTIYVRAEDPITHCVKVIPITLEINPSPLAPTTTSLPDITTCDHDNNPYNAITGVNLSAQTSTILAAQPLPAVNYLVTYYTSQALAQTGQNPIVQTTNYQGSDGQTIWVRIQNVNSNCFNIGSFTLHINIPLALTTPPAFSLCDDDGTIDQHHVFDLTIRDTAILGGNLGYTVAYYPSYAEALSGSNVITTPTTYVNALTPVQTLGVVVTSSAGCKSKTTLDIRVLNIPTPKDPSTATPPLVLAPQCETTVGSGVALFNLTTNANYIINNDPQVTLHYFTNLADANSNQNPIATPATALVGGDVFIRVENTQVDYQGHNCYKIVTQPLTVNPLPTIVSGLKYYKCELTNTGFASFDLQTQIAALLGSQNPSNFTVSFYATQADAIAGAPALPLTNFTNTTINTQTVYVRVVNNTTGCINATGTLDLKVEQAAKANPVTPIYVCDDATVYTNPNSDTHDGVLQIDLTSFASQVLLAQDPTIFLVSYYTSQAGATTANPLELITTPTAYITQPDTDSVWIRVTNSNSTSPCFDVTQLQIKIERYADPSISTINGVTSICVDYTTGLVVRPLLLTANNTVPGNYSYQWFNGTTAIPGETNATYSVTTTTNPSGGDQTFSVQMTSIPHGCAVTSPTFTVHQSGQAAIVAGTAGYVVTNAFSDNQVITVNIVGYGTYEYSLDDGPHQTSPVFTNVTLGSHTIYVWDTKDPNGACEALLIEDVQIVDYPHFFTPNGDGINDTWNVNGLAKFVSTTKIYIFDRFGKLIKQISPSGEGWDGTYNGTLLPSDDYWFSVDYLEINAAKQFKAHFALKR